jgi:hypothetical protein
MLLLPVEEKLYTTFSVEVEKINFKPYKKPPAPLDDLLRFDGGAR